jgi:hypothetical protein
LLGTDIVEIVTNSGHVRRGHSLFVNERRIGAVFQEHLSNIRVSPGRRHVKCSSPVFALFVYVCASFNEHACNVDTIWPRTLSGEPQRRVAAITIRRTTIDDIHIHASSKLLPDGLDIAHPGSRMDWVEASFNRTPRRYFLISHASPHQIRLATACQSSVARRNEVAGLHAV